MPVTGTEITSSTPEYGTTSYLEARIAACYTQLEQLEESAVEEYGLDNAGQRQSVTYRKMEAINKQIQFYERKLARIKSKGGRSLAVLRRGGY